MKQLKILIISLLIYSIYTTALANLSPQSLVTDGRIQVVPYQVNNVVAVTGSTFVSTQIVFGISLTFKVMMLMLGVLMLISIYRIF